MDITLNFLGWNSSLTKTFGFSNRKMTKLSYPMAANFTSYEVQVSNLGEFRNSVIKHAALGHCLLKGTLSKPLVNERRTGQTDSDTPTQWMLLDIDGLPYPPEKLMLHLGLQDMTYFVQYSTSSGLLVPGGLESEVPKDRYHIYCLLGEEITPDILKAELMSWNLNIPALSQSLKLTKSGVSLSYPLDITVCQNDKLVYIAPPICNDGVIDTLRDNRIGEIING